MKRDGVDFWGQRSANGAFMSVTPDLTINPQAERLADEIIAASPEMANPVKHRNCLAKLTVEQLTDRLATIIKQK